MPSPGVVWAEHYATGGNLETGKHRSGNLPGVTVTGMGGDATDRAYLLLRWREIGSYVLTKGRRVGRIKSAYNCRLAYYRHRPSLKRVWSGLIAQKSAHGTAPRSVPATMLLPGSQVRFSPSPLLA